MYHTYRAFIELVGKDPDLFFTDVDSFRKWCDYDWHKNEERILGGEYYPNKTLNEFFHVYHDGLVKLFPWVPESLELLSKKYRFAILSSSVSVSVKGSLGDLSRYFSCIVGAEEVIKLKPDPEGVLLILKEMDTEINDAMIIGDTHVDFFAGKRAGIKTGLVKWGMGDWEELSILGADLLFERPEELLEL